MKVTRDPSLQYNGIMTLNLEIIQTSLSDFKYSKVLTMEIDIQKLTALCELSAGDKKVLTIVVQQ